ncbi:VCBS repeat-containing protein [Microbaculum marinum]|uniref:VCBS repeat-containing protein n=1 Tax=Microbaculum marinum TaxID=1764581 RepID=A0AAW9RUB3_9HYPH
MVVTDRSGEGVSGGFGGHSRLVRLLAGLGAVLALWWHTDGTVLAQARLSDGRTARAGGSGVVQAWYVQPTTRYRHGILGDPVEAGGLAVRDSTGRQHVLTLPDDSVFEDLTPRLADLDGDGAAEVVAVRSYLTRGSALAVFGMRNGELVRLAETAPIGRPARWLNPAGIADFNGDGRPEIAIVKTPHVGGTLEFWRFGAGSLSRIAAAGGFSNHVIGSRQLGLSALVDVDRDGVVDLVLPDAGRTVLVAVGLSGGRLRIIGRAPLPGPVVGNLAVAGERISAGLAGGGRASVSLADFR